MGNDRELTINGDTMGIYPERVGQEIRPYGTLIRMQRDTHKDIGDESKLNTIWLFNIAMENHHF
jgi:hypothetical protein